MTNETQQEQRNQAMGRIVELGDEYYVLHGRFPTRIRVGTIVGERIFPKGCSRADMPDFVVELDIALQPDEVALDD